MFCLFFLAVSIQIGQKKRQMSTSPQVAFFSSIKVIKTLHNSHIFILMKKHSLQAWRSDQDLDST